MKTKFKSDFVKSLSLLILIIVIPIVGFHLNKAPQAVPDNAPLTEFSAVRAMKHMEHIALKSHYIGANEHEKVREYIVDELKKMGIEPEIQVAEVFYPDKYLAAIVRNIIVKIHGTESSKSVLIVGHYDSVRDSYGASDDGSAVVTMLETIRLLRLKQPFKNDIIFLFTDGEEIGLTGASAFIENHPLAKNVGLVLNFDSNGTSGPSTLYQTSNDNNWIIIEFSKAVPFPIANSIFYEASRNGPDETDFSIFKKNGLSGFNFLFFETKFDVHTGGDNAQNISIESIQHHGSYASSLIQHFANIKLDNIEKGNAVYFNTIGKGFVHYSYKWIVPFVIVTLLLLLVILFIGFRRKILRPIRLLYGFLAFIIHFAIAPSIVTLICFILIKYYPGNDFRLLFYNQNILLLGLVGITVAISFSFYHLALKGIRIWQLILFVSLIILMLIWSSLLSLMTILATVGIGAITWFLYRKPTNVWELSLGSSIGWAILMVAGSIMIPGASYLFTWPLLFSLIPVGILFFRENRNEYSILQVFLFLAASLPILIWVPNLTYIFFTWLGLKMAGEAILFTMLCLSILIIHIEIITRIKPWFVPLISFSVGLFLLLYGSVNLQYSVRHKQQNSLILATNGNTNETLFTSYENQTDDWTVDYLTKQPDTSRLEDFNLFGKRNFIIKRIETENLPTPTLIVMNDSVVGSQRLLKLHLNSGRKADKLYVQIKSNSDSIKAAINNSEMKELKLMDGTEWYLLRYYALPEEGIDMELKLLEKQNIEISLTDIVYGLPVLGEVKIKQRPDYMMSNGDMTMATKKFIIRN